MSASEPQARQNPKSLTDLFVSFSWLALQGFGGVLTIAQRELVERKRWMTREEFLEEWSVAQIMPGPNIINLCITFGSRHFGIPGALASIAGMLTLPLLLLLTLALVYAQFATHPGVVGALRGMGAVAGGLIIAGGLKLIPALKKNALGLWLCAIAGTFSFIGVALLHWTLAYVLLGVGLICCTLAYRKLKP